MERCASKGTGRGCSNRAASTAAEKLREWWRAIMIGGLDGHVPLGKFLFQDHFIEQHSQDVLCNMALTCLMTSEALSSFILPSTPSQKHAPLHCRRPGSTRVRSR
ncbi:hypothetical protein BDN71DRAFT_674895 [Pleurotus eryngii]|uniref:Uncharacterized protein n=1 Tax=Pleurotus eryngii TaxID=5323 RepID=A0A9P6A483_PLEER|nr:hypothetical protein BDN71DRAFT_674895 [Pleurotus eryngii]